MPPLTDSSVKSLYNKKQFRLCEYIGIKSPNQTVVLATSQCSLIALQVLFFHHIYYFQHETDIFLISRVEMKKEDLYFFTASMEIINEGLKLMFLE